MDRMNLFGKEDIKLDKDKIKEVFSLLNEKLIENNLYVELNIYGGTVMNLLYDVRPATRDIDCTFVVTDYKLFTTILDDIRFIYNLESNWFNDDIKEPLKHLTKEDLNEWNSYTNLKIMIPKKEQLLAMKLLSARSEPSNDFIDAYLLCKDLEITSKQMLLDLFKQYLPLRLLGERQLMFIRYLGEDLGYDWK